MATKPALLEALGRHSKRSRVTWHSGSIPPYSSLWITIQRFLFLNEPSRDAFAKDFLTEAIGNNARWFSRPPLGLLLNEYQRASDQNVVRLTRFARVIKESPAAFRGCHITHFPKMARPYFGDFAVCPSCLAEGFHSILYSFEGLRECPAHGLRLETMAAGGAIAPELFANATRSPFMKCPSLEELVKAAQMRHPKASSRRNEVLSEIADWLMDLDSRCWLGQHGSRQAPIFLAFTERLVHLKVAIGLPNPIPNWMNSELIPASNGSSEYGTANIVQFGTMKIRKGDLVRANEGQALDHLADLNTYEKAIVGDFKAIWRYLKRRHLQGRGRHWLACLEKTSIQTDVLALLQIGGEQACCAWLLLTWWRQVNARQFNGKVGLHTRPTRFAVAGDIPLWVGVQTKTGKRKTQDDHVHMWVARWISAAGILAFWGATCEAARSLELPEIMGLGQAVPLHWPEPEWSLGISSDDVLKLRI